MRRTVLLLAAMALTLVVASGVAFAVTKVGTKGDDVLKGTNEPDTLFGKGGNDSIFGKGGDDEQLSGGTGNDRVYGGPGKDIMNGGNPPATPTSLPPIEFSANNSDHMDGGGGPDLIDGNRGADRIFGGPGDDALFDGEGRRGPKDVIYGNEGDDFIFPFNKPAGRDVVLCGDGRDTVYADREDVLTDCEEVHFRPPTAEEFGPIFEQFFGNN